MSTVRANTILDTAGGNTATINGMTPTAQSLQGFRNRIINGDMRIDQRNAGVAVTPAGVETYTVDRFSYIGTQASKITFQQNAGAVTPPTGFTNYLGFTVASAVASPAAGDQFAVYHKIEGLNVADFAFGSASATTVTVSFWVRSSLTGTFSGGLVNSAGNRSYVFNYTINSANTWEQKTVTIAGDTTGTWLTTNGIGIQLRLDLGSGSNQDGTASAWQAGDKMRTSSSVRFVSTSGATFYITGVQLEAGSVATPFERRSYGTELALCQRYFYVFGAFNFATNAFYNGYFGGSTAVLNVRYPVQMRATPTATVSQPTQVQYYSQSGVWTNTTITVRAYNAGGPNYNTGTTDITIGCDSDSSGGGKLLYLAGGASTTLPTVSVSAEL